MKIMKWILGGSLMVAGAAFLLREWKFGSADAAVVVGMLSGENALETTMAV